MPSLIAHLRRKAGRPEAQALEVVDRIDLVPEPACPLRPAIAAEEGLETEAGVHLVVELLPAAMRQPADLLVGPETEGLRAEDEDALGLRAPVGGHGVVEFRRALGHRIEHLVAWDDLAGGEELDLDPPTRERGDTIGQHLRGNAGPGQVTRPGGDHPPSGDALADCRLAGSWPPWLQPLRQ
jgi:hypothetical protein